MQSVLDKIIFIAKFVSFFVRKSYLSFVLSFEIQMQIGEYRGVLLRLLGKGLKVLFLFIP